MLNAEELQVTVVSDGAGPTIAVCGEIDLATADQFETSLTSVDGDRITVDLRGVTFMGSTGIRALLHADRAVRARGGTMVVRSCSRPVAVLFDVVGLGSVLNVER